MSDREWASGELLHYQKEELAAIERVKNAKENLAKATAELAAAQGALAGARNCIAEFTFQMKHLEEHGELP
jgi:uncharacterized protein (DUF3084 family)